MSKKKVGFVTAYPGLKTGFSRNAKALLSHLWDTDKYEIFHLAQGMQDNHPDFQRWPWKTEGVFRNFDQNRFNQDPNYQRVVAYGNTVVEEFVTKHKLDVLILQEDPWAFDADTYYKSDWYKVIKENTLLHITPDSLPILPAIKDWAKNCPNTWAWASFAEKALKNEDGKVFEHFKTVPGCLDTNKFVPLNSQERSLLREKMGIKADETIILHLGRNQLRKLFWANIEALARLRKTNPDYKVKLLLHCSWSEGWPLEQTIREAGLSKEDVLTTYYCKHCHQWEVKPFSGEDQDCRFCSTKKSQNTAGVNSGIDESELAKIYGICDAASSVFTSGGLEYFNVESLLCGLPLGCTDYSCGTDFTNQKFVYPFIGTMTRECGTDFYKFVPDIANISKFFRQVVEMTPDERRKLGAEGRSWALEKFSIPTIGKIYENFIDSRPEINWDTYHHKKTAPKNPNYPMPNIPENGAWLRDMYKNILNMEVSNDDTGLLYWIQGLSNGMQRQQVYQFFIETAQKENLKNVKQDDLVKQIFKHKKEEIILINIPESLGDCIYITSLLESARTIYADKKIYIATKDNFKEVFLPLVGSLVDEVITWQAGFDNSLAMEKDHVLVNYCPHFSTQRMINYTHNGSDKTNIEF